MSAAELATFSGAAARYWLAVYPRACRELRRWRARAMLIPDASLRDIALAALQKRGNIEGAAAFAVLADSRHRGAVVRALVAFQAAYNYADTLAEQPSADPVEHARRAHASLLDAFEYEESLQTQTRDGAAEHDDGGYLAEMIATCRTAFWQLPSSHAVAVSAHAAAQRIVDFQSLSAGDAGQLERWARAQDGADRGLAWWESAAAAGSSLDAFALIATAATPSPTPEALVAVARAYTGPIGALHSLLDSLVDEAEDAAIDQLSLIGCYRSRRDAATRMRWLAQEALREASTLPAARLHTILTTAMVCHYLSDRALSAEARTLARGVRGTLGGLEWPTLLIFRVRDARAA